MAQFLIRSHDAGPWRAVDTAHKLLRKFADKRAEGCPEASSVEDVLQHILDIFTEATYLRLPLLAAADPVWLSWSGGTVTTLAQAINDERAFDLLPILADALEEAGCTDDDLLSHCRGAELHVLGCWVVELLLGEGTSSVSPPSPQRGGKTPPGDACESDSGQRYECAVAESYRLLRRSAEEWAEGNPEDPPTGSVLREILDIFITGRFLRLLGNPHAHL